jgi:release factor glutamine methyltransferase
VSTTWRRLQGWAADELRAAGVDGAEQEARWMVEEASGHDGSEFLEVVDAEPVERARGRLESMVARRCGGEPLQYVLGRWAFRGLDLMVDRRVLVPRPETESVVDAALGEVDRLLERVDPGDDVVVVDLGTGSGAIALSVAAERVRTHVWATDRSGDALVVATANLGGLGRAAARVRIAQGSWFEALDDDLRGRIGVVVSNPPYVDRTAPLPAQVVDWEPHAALFADDGGRADLEVIVAGAGSWLRPDGALVCELSPEQAPWALALAREDFGEARVLRDLAGRERTLLARHPLR